jgi:hypothetical protein
MNTEPTKKVTTKRLRYFYTEEELRKIAEQMAEKAQEIDEKEADKKAITSELKAAVDVATNEHRLLAGKYRAKSEYREVECEVLSDHKKGIVTTTRLDTGEVIDERAMTTGERQRELPLVEAAGKVMKPSPETNVTHRFITDGEDEEDEDNVPL